MICRNCGAPIADGEMFCGNCGESVNNQLGGGYQYEPTPPMPQPVNQPTIAKSDVNWVCLIATAVCALLWLFAPCLQGEVSSGWGRVTKVSISGFDLMKMLSAASQYGQQNIEDYVMLAVVAPIIGIIICFICVLVKRPTATRVFAVLTELVLAIIIFVFLNLANGHSEVLKVFGFGFWGMIVGLIVVICTAGKKRTS